MPNIANTLRKRIGSYFLSRAEDLHVLADKYEERFAAHVDRQVERVVERTDDLKRRKGRGK